VKASSTAVATTVAAAPSLPVTGSSSGPMAVLGLGLMAAGAGLLVVRRRRLAD
jgi:LPXTG-motif cell wall-anchored protein